MEETRERAKGYGIGSDHVQDVHCEPEALAKGDSDKHRDSTERDIDKMFLNSP
jgi:hypothetical protein